jgi:hypothetical protein
VAASRTALGRCSPQSERMIELEPASSSNVWGFRMPDDRACCSCCGDSYVVVYVALLVAVEMTPPTTPARAASCGCSQPEGHAVAFTQAVGHSSGRLDAHERLDGHIPNISGDEGATVR